MKYITLAWRFTAIVVYLLAISGCGGDMMPLGKAEGKVLLHGQPLQFGSVMFQPQKGPAARATIQPDGSFILSTYGEGDGAVIGIHSVLVKCFTTQDPNTPPLPNTESPQGRLLIPDKYTRFETSGLTANVKPQNEPFIFDLK